VERVVRRSLKTQGETLVGLQKENPRTATATPTADCLFQAFVSLLLIQRTFPETMVWQVLPLHTFQQHILPLLGISSDLSSSLARTIPRTPFPLRE